MTNDKIYDLNITHKNHEKISWKNKLIIRGNFFSCDFSECNWLNVGLFRVNISDCRFVGSTFRNVKFKECVLSTSNLIYSTFINCIFEDCELLLNGLSFSHMESVKFKDCSTEMTMLGDATLKFMEGWVIKSAVDSKGNKMLYNVTERWISHSILVGTPEDCVHKVWSGKGVSTKYSDELVQMVIELSDIKTGNNTLK